MSCIPDREEKLWGKAVRDAEEKTVILVLEKAVKPARRWDIKISPAARIPRLYVIVCGSMTNFPGSSSEIWIAPRRAAAGKLLPPRPNAGSVCGLRSQEAASIIFSIKIP